MFYKIYERSAGLVLAVCDADICGKTLGEFFVNPHFYKDKRAGKKKIIKLLSVCYSANLVGKEAVGIAEEVGLVDEDSIIMLGDVPHAQILIMQI